ncbi:hypothetical protein GCM10028822_40080 [Hymenobacter terrigena]
MLKHVTASGLLATLLLTGCSSTSGDAPADGQLAFNNFENLDGWLADSPALATINREKAHSGVYSTKVSPGHDYSLGYSNTLERFSPDWPAKITVSAWVLLPNDQANAKLVTQVKSPNAGSDLVWEGLELNKVVKVYNKWQHVEQTITMPEAAKPDSRLLVYLWRADSKEPVYLDDLEISLAK